MTLTHSTTERLLFESEAARMLAVSPRTLRNWRTLGNGPAYIKISGRCIRYRHADLIEFVDARSRRHTSRTTHSRTPTK